MIGNKKLQVSYQFKLLPCRTIIMMTRIVIMMMIILLVVRSRSQSEWVLDVRVTHTGQPEPGRLGHRRAAARSTEVLRGLGEREYYTRRWGWGGDHDLGGKRV
jgi:hypothetical protein